MTSTTAQARNVVLFMSRLVFSPGNSGGAAAVLRWAALLVVAVCAMRPLAASADCFPSSDAPYLALDPQVDRNATQTLSALAARFQALEHAGSPADPRQLAALYAVKAVAYSILALVNGPTDPLRLELLSTSALNIYTQDGIREAMATIQAARDAQPVDSLPRTCLEITLGTLQRRAGENAQAARTLIRAYHDTEMPARAEAHSMAASALSSALRAVGDLEEALTLQRERIAWDTAHGNSLALSVSTYLEGEILEAVLEFHEAIATFEQARNISVSLGDTQGVAFSDMRICQTLIELKQYPAARSSCNSAARVFAASKTTDVLKETKGYLASIDLSEGRAYKALQTLNGVLDHNGTDIDPRRV